MLTITWYFRAAKLRNWANMINFEVVFSNCLYSFYWLGNLLALTCLLVMVRCGLANCRATNVFV